MESPSLKLESTLAKAKGTLSVNQGHKSPSQRGLGSQFSAFRGLPGRTLGDAPAATWAGAVDREPFVDAGLVEVMRARQDAEVFIGLKIGQADSTRRICFLVVGKNVAKFPERQLGYGVSGSSLLCPTVGWLNPAKPLNQAREAETHNWHQKDRNDAW